MNSTYCFTVIKQKFTNKLWWFKHKILYNGLSKVYFINVFFYLCNFQCLNSNNYFECYKWVYLYTYLIYILIHSILKSKTFIIFKWLQLYKIILILYKFIFAFYIIKFLKSSHRIWPNNLTSPEVILNYKGFTSNIQYLFKWFYKKHIGT